MAAMNWEQWMYSSTLAPVDLDFSTSELNSAKNLAFEYVALGGNSSPADKDIFFTFYSNLKVVFYDTLSSQAGLNTAIMARIDADYNSTGDADPEVKQRWLSTGIMLGYSPALEPAH
jgi:hypothetical protein